MATQSTQDLRDNLVILLQEGPTAGILSFLEQHIDDVQLVNFALEWSSRWNKVIVLKWLIERAGHHLRKQVDFATELKYADLLLGIACRDGAIGTIRLLVEKCGVRVDTSFNGREQEPLSKACDSGNADVVRYLLERGANPNITSANGPVSFPLLSAAYAGNLPLVKVLVEHGAAVNGLNPFGLTPLSYALMKNDPETVAYLRSVGALEPWQIRGEASPPPPPEPKPKSKKRKG